MKNDKIKEARKKLGMRIRELRNAAGITQEDLGEKSALNYKFIGELERGQVNVSLDSIVKIAEALGVRLDSFFSQDKNLAQKIFIKGKDPISSLSAQDLSHIKKALTLLNKTFRNK